MKPTIKPNNPNFSSGPCSKRPGYSVDKLQLDTLGRSHRSSIGKQALAKACEQTAEILGLPEGYRVGVVPASDTGAVEMIMWSVLGARPVDIFAWESFGRGWLTDAVKQLKLDNLNSYTADYGVLPDLTQAKSRVRAYKVRGTPEIIVNGKYRISSTKAGGFSGMLKVAEFLIDKERGLTAK